MLTLEELSLKTNVYESMGIMSQKSQKPHTANAKSIELTNLDDSLEDFIIQPRKLRKTKSSQEISKLQMKSDAVPNNQSNVKDTDFDKTQSTSSFKTITHLKKESQLPKAAVKCMSQPVQRREELKLKTIMNDVEFVKSPISISKETSLYWATKSSIAGETKSLTDVRIIEKPHLHLNEILTTKTEDDLKNPLPENLESCKEVPAPLLNETSISQTKDVPNDFTMNMPLSPLKKMPPLLETSEEIKPSLNLSYREVLKEVDPSTQSPCPICDNVVKDLPNHIKICCIEKFSFTKKNVPDNGIICSIQYDAASGSKKEVKRETCSICEKDITYMTKHRRLQHVNKCGDKIPMTVEKLKEMMTFPCPFCGVDNATSESRIVHLKRCGKKFNLQPETLIAAAQLTEKHEAERKALGLPNLARPKTKPSKKKKKIFQFGSPKNHEEAELQMAMALSASIHEEQNSENSVPEISPLEVENQAKEQAQFSGLFSSAMLPPHKAKGKKKKPVKLYKLALLTEEERSRQLQWKVSELLEGQFNSTPDVLNWLQTADKCKLWVLTALKGDLSRKDFYIEDLFKKIEPDEMSVNFKPKHLHFSQIAGRQSFSCTANVSKMDLDETGQVIISTPPLTQTQSHFCKDVDDTLGGFISQNDYREGSSSKRKISSDYSRIVGKKEFSDATILASDGQIPIHLIIISIRCPLLLDEFSNEQNLDLKEFKCSAVLGFLEFVYTGEYNFDVSILDEVKKLALRYEQNDLLELLNQKQADLNDPVVLEEKENQIYQLANQTLHKLIHSVWQEPISSSENDTNLTKKSDYWDNVLDSNIVLSLSQFISQDNEIKNDSEKMSEIFDEGENSVFLPDREESMDLLGCEDSANLTNELNSDGLLNQHCTSLPNAQDSDNSLNKYKPSLPNNKDCETLLNRQNSAILPDRQDCASLPILPNRLDKVDLFSTESSDLPIPAAENTSRVKSQDHQFSVIDLCDSNKSQKQLNDALNQEIFQLIKGKSNDSDEKLLCGDTTLFHQAILDDPNSPEAITIHSSSSEANSKHTTLRCKSEDLSSDTELPSISPNGSFLLKNLREKTIEILNEDTMELPILVCVEKTSKEKETINNPVKNGSNLSFKDRLRNGYYNVIPQSPLDDFPECDNNAKKKSPRSPIKKFSPKRKTPVVSPTTGIWLNKKSVDTSSGKCFGSRTSLSKLPTESPKNSQVEASKKILFPKDDKQAEEERSECVSSPDIFASDNEYDNKSLNSSLESIKFISAKDSPVNERVKCTSLRSLKETDNPEGLPLSSPETPLPLAQRLKRNALPRKISNTVCSSSTQSNMGLKRNLLLSPENKKRSKTDCLVDEMESEAAKMCGLSNFKNFPDVDGLSPSSEEKEGPISMESVNHTQKISKKGESKLSKLNTKIRISSTQPEKSKRKNDAHVPCSQPARKKNKQTPPVTPMPDYKTMVTPDLKEALKKVGVKALPRSKAVPLLTHIYDATHPYVSDLDDCPSTSQMPPPAHSKSPKNVSEKPKNVTSEKIKAPLVLDDGLSSDFSSSQESSGSSGGGEMLEESTISIDGSQGVNELDYKSKLKLYIKSNPELHMQILTYKPIPLREFYENLQINGIKLTMPTLMDFLDEQCITFTLPRSEKQREKQQRRHKRFKDRVRAKLKG